MARPIKKNSMVAAAQLAPTDQVDHRELRQRDLPEPRDRQALAGIGGIIAKDYFYIRNSRLPNAQKHFPVDPIKRTADKCFSHAVGGALYIDEPTSLAEVKICKEKALAMKLEGVRYAYIDQDMELEDVLKQLEGTTIGVA